MMKYASMFPILIALFAIACSSPPPPLPTPFPIAPTDTPTPTVVVPTPNIDATVEARVDERVSEIVARTATAVAAIPPTATSTATSTSTPTRFPTSTSTPTSVPVATIAPTATFTPTPIPTIAPSSTPSPVPTATSVVSTPAQSNGPTEVNGLLFGDNVWSLDGSPYILSGNVVVPQGAVLAIRPGVEVDLDGWLMRIDGTLRAIGASDNKINFTGLRRTNNGNFIEFGPDADAWVERTSAGNLVEHAVFRLNTALEDAAIKVNGSAPRFSFIDVTNPRSSGLYLRGPAILEDSRVCDNFDWGVLAESSAVIRRNVICGNRVFGILVRDSSPHITGNIVQGNNWLGNEFQGGISVELRRAEGLPVIELNNISDNLGFGIRVLGERVVGNTVITRNIIVGNELLQARLGETRADVDMTGNWWGTTNRTAIASKIYDEDDEFGLKQIFFLPLSSSPPDGVPVLPE